MIIILNASKVTYTSNGTQTVFSFPFDYLRKSFISVTAGDTALVYGTHYSVTNKEVTLANAAASGTLIVIERTTPTTRLVEWQDASVLTANDMTISEVQNLHILEEQNTFILNNAIYLNADKVWEGLNRRIANVSDPINDQDVVTLGYVNKNETGLLTKLKNAYDTYMADLLAKYTQYKDTLLSNYSTYTSNLSADFTNYTASMLAKYNEYMTSMLNTKDTYLANLKAKYNEYMDSLTLTITTASTTITGYMVTTKGYMDTASAKATVATDKATEATTQADRAEQIASGLSALSGVTGVATEADATAGTSETLIMTPKTTKSIVGAETTARADAISAEATARDNADTALNTSLTDTINATKTALTNDINTRVQYVNGGKIAPFIVDRQDAEHKGGEIRFNKADNNPDMSLDVYDNSFRFLSSSGILLQINANGTLYASSNQINPVVGYVGNPSSGYMRYKNGYCVQWGINGVIARATRSNFYIGYATTPIVVAIALTNGAEGNTGTQSNPCIRDIDTSGFYFCHNDSGSHFAGHTWVAFGHVQPV